MMKFNIGIVVLTSVFIQSLCIQVLLNDVVTSRTQFCVGESLTLVCNNNTNTYSWRVGNIITGNNLLVTPGRSTFTVMNFTATLISLTESRLQFVISAMFDNNTVFTCLDVINAVEVSTTTLQLHGNPSAPRIQSVMWYTQSLYYLMVIYPPDTPCVTNYCVEITESSSQGTQVFHHIFEAVRSDRFQAFIITRNIIQSLNPCSSNYTFSVRACNSNETDVRVGQNLFKVNLQRCPSIASGFIELNDGSEQQSFIVNQAKYFSFSELTSGILYNITIIIILPNGRLLNVESIPFTTRELNLFTSTKMNEETTPRVCQCWSWIGSLLSIIVISTAIISTLVSVIVIQGFRLRSQQCNCVHTKTDKKSKIENHEVMFEDCIAYGKVSINQSTDSAVMASTNAEVHGVYEAI